MSEKVFFTKMHGCGNDYIYIDCIKNQYYWSDEELEQIAIRLSDRHFGIGGDGIILIKKGCVADFEMMMFNADGSRGAMCGNGIRCVAKFVYDAHYTKNFKCPTEFTIESMRKVKKIQVQTDDNDKVLSATVDMEKPILSAKEIPVIIADEKTGNGENCEVSSIKLSSETASCPKATVNVKGKSYTLNCVSMGNPHAVIFLNSSPREFPVTTLGREFENLAIFPNRTNTEFAYIIDKSNIEMRVWERGSGETLACGTGACATAVAAILLGLVDKSKEITIHLLGGDLKIRWSGDKNDSVIMSGKAETVFTGCIEI